MYRGIANQARVCQDSNSLIGNNRLEHVTSIQAMNTETFVTSIKFVRTGANTSTIKNCMLCCGFSNGQFSIYQLPIANVQGDIQPLITMDEKNDVPVHMIQTSATKHGICIAYSKFTIIRAYSWCNMTDLVNNVSPKKFTVNDHSGFVTGVDMKLDVYGSIVLYSSSFDGSVMEHKLSSSPTTSRYILEKDSVYPVWGCALSPNKICLMVARQYPGASNRHMNMADKDKLKLLYIYVSTCSNEEEFVKIVDSILNGEQLTQSWVDLLHLIQPSFNVDTICNMLKDKAYGQ